jgi:hypothetical protein
VVVFLFCIFEFRFVICSPLFLNRTRLAEKSNFIFIFTDKSCDEWAMYAIQNETTSPRGEGGKVGRGQGARNGSAREVIKNKH